MKISTYAVSPIVLCTLMGCAEMPNVQVIYYQPTATLDLTVTQTATCMGGDIPVLVTDVTPNGQVLGRSGETS